MRQAANDDCPITAECIARNLLERVSFHAAGIAQTGAKAEQVRGERAPVQTWREILQLRSNGRNLRFWSLQLNLDPRISAQTREAMSLLQRKMDLAEARFRLAQQHASSLSDSPLVGRRPAVRAT
jgi:hypothetical protein